MNNNTTIRCGQEIFRPCRPNKYIARIPDKNKMYYQSLLQILKKYSVY